MSEEIKDQEAVDIEAEGALDAEMLVEASDADEDDGVIIHDADAEDALETFRAKAAEQQDAGAEESRASETDAETPHSVRSMEEMMGIVEALVFVAEEPISTKALADVLKEDRGWIEIAVTELAKEFNARNGGLQLREVAGGWQFATRPEHHEHVRAFLKSRPSAKLSLASLETLAVIAYKQPITVPEILEIRGVQSPSAIKTLLDKRLIVAKGRKETIGRPMMYGTSKEFLLQFGLKDLTELPSIEDFEDLAGGAA
jgi:segregation and condensation protein B